jgi:hypothetical protein
VLCGTLLGKSPLVSTSFANLTIDQGLEAVRNPIATYSFIILLHDEFTKRTTKVFSGSNRVSCPEAARIYRIYFSIWMSRPMGPARLSRQGKDFVRRPNMIAHACLYRWRRARNAQGSFKVAKSPACSCVSLQLARFVEYAKHSIR